MAALSPPIYRPADPGPTTCLRQGEILADLAQVVVATDSIGNVGPPKVNRRLHPIAIILTQDCDLEQDFKARVDKATGDKLIPSVLFAEVNTAEEVRQSPGMNSTIWARVRINKDERYHFLQKVEPAADAQKQGLPELAIDFKRYFTVPTDEVYKRVEVTEAKRRCVLVSPYLEHLSSRFAYFLGRVALPEDHFSEAPPRP